jgi:hypothetical protein
LAVGAGFSVQPISVIDNTTMHRIEFFIGYLENWWIGPRLLASGQMSGAIQHLFFHYDTKRKYSRLFPCVVGRPGFRSPGVFASIFLTPTCC